MSRRFLMLIASLSLLGLSHGCASVNSALGGNTQKEAKAEVSWDYKSKGIQVELLTSHDMNAYFNQPHTLVLGVFQLENSKSFMTLLGDSKSLTSMLASGRADKDILQFDRYVVSPDKRTIIEIDRVQDAKYVGFVAGYYNFDAPAASRLFRIPLNIQTDGLVSTTYKAEPANMAIRLYLGRQRIMHAQSLTFDPDKKPVLETIPLETPPPEIKLDDKALEDAQEASGAARKLR